MDQLLGAPAAVALVDTYGREQVTDALRAVVETVRAAVTEAMSAGAPEEWTSSAGDAEYYLALAASELAKSHVPSLRRVINATGVVLHTNLGRAPLASVAVEAMRTAAGEYSNLEFDLEEGVRGSRYTHCVRLLTELTGAADALVVNNAAGALVLALNTAAGGGGGVAVSRGELVEIGGGFRIPEVLERSGARLVEVGSTNRTRAADYRAALDDEEAVAVLKVHRSNFRITGFTEEVGVDELSALARERGVPLIHDLGSGLMVEAERVGLPHEPRARESLAAGADVVVVSGDKLLGGPQAGILVGDADLMARMRKNPLCRALRVDKVGLAGLEATLRLYRNPPRALSEIPTLRMLAENPDSLRARAETLLEEMNQGVAAAWKGRVPEGAEGPRPVGTVVPARGAVGGGTFPGVELDSWAIRLDTPPDHIARRLRDGDPPVVGHIADGAFLLDVRTVLPGQESELVRSVVEAMTS